MRQRTAVAATIGVVLALGAGVSAAVGGGNSPQPPPGEQQALLAADLGKLKREEARLAQGRVTADFSFGDQRVLIARAPDGTGAAHTVFAVMTYEPEMAEWYPAETVDRPQAGTFTWAQVALASGQRVFAWDSLPAGKDIYINGTALHAGDAAGAVTWDEEIGPEDQVEAR